MPAKQPIAGDSKPEIIIEPELSPQARLVNAAKAAGADRVIKLMTTHPMRKTVEGYLKTLGDHASYLPGTDLENEITGVKEAIKWVKKNYEGSGDIGDAAPVLAELNAELKKRRVAAQVEKAAELRKSKGQTRGQSQGTK